ncbi:valine--tRNA ligase [Desulfurispira natronophila]|uniref:Valine--tRNA ligase n=1 Tax=Desulfurispira natronophila TaxID=682562 RepID=A0A7W7Y305_9BACT|nr:valine--tRNA ligase [Desulfurispira natronophila]MBB5021161.1 valyl-tRNA synthetase [Desulfurispira natronophila]
MSLLPKYYEPAQCEEKWYQHWLENGYFHADENSSKPPYSIVIPPPNVTGYLHIGHALCMTLQDVLIRYKRMDGYEALWLPGTDHASIATQIVVEKQLEQKGLDRREMGRDAFLEKVWEWKEHSGNMIVQQLKRLGCSCDWERERFTMDEQCNRGVMQAFVKLYEQGIIYRGKRLVNWCPVQRTSLSDLEVIHEDVEGAMYYITYPIEGSDESFTIATTRPETLLGDTAVIVHPEDERYRHFIGQRAVLPLCGRTIPILGDDYVDPQFGSGAMKVTPAHDFNDFEIGKRHGLQMINVFAEDATINSNAPAAYQGMDRFAARKAIVADLENQGLLVKVEKHLHSVGKAERSGAIVEPFLSDQWYVNVGEMAERASDAVRTGDVQFVPKNWEKTYFHWMDNIRDWCISRQLWWGHRIPAWYCRDCGHITVTVEMEVHRCEKCASGSIEQDEDVLDTWFSSQLWPFSTMGWPDRTDTLEKFYPTSVLVTAFDIIFFWVARMIMAGYTFMDRKPFQEVYIHALVRDKYGRKMSKSIGNVIDPLGIIDQYGADALRYTLISQAGQGRDIKLDIDRIEGYTNFINKMWNALRFTLQTLPQNPNTEDLPQELAISDAWILGRLNATIESVRYNLDHYHFNEASAALYRFIWQELCDWYIELAKHRLYKGSDDEKQTASAVLCHCLRSAMQLLHPFMPFVSEEIYQHLPGKGESIMIDPFPQPANLDQWLQPIGTMEKVMAAIEAVRSVRGEMNISPAQGIEAHLVTDDPQLSQAAGEYHDYFQALARIDRIQVASNATEMKAQKGIVSAVFSHGEILLPLAGIVDFAGELQRLQKEYKKIEKDFRVYDKKLSNPGFLRKAPEDVILKDRHRHQELNAILAKLETNMAQMKEHL